MRKKVTVLVAAAMMLATTLALGTPAFAQGGCKNFGVGGVADQARNQPGGMGGYARFFAREGDMSAVIHASQDELCSGGAQ